MEDIITGRIDLDNLWVGRTPWTGQAYTMRVRPGTSDWNTANAVALGEYPLPRGISGWALDIGAHIGAVTVPLALMNPGLRILAVEAMPENIPLLVENIGRNGLTDGRITIVHAAASDSPEPVRIYYGGDHQHQFIGSDGGSTYQEVKGATLRGLMLLRGVDEDEPFIWAKLDCEGCEYPLLSSPHVGALQHIVGEVHRGWDRLVQLLAATHDVTGDGLDFGHFEAVLKVQS